ncbi:glycine oxidase ThiO [Paenibacillus selenitireducens]|uniref:glycine oxidase n=1 Tax=Paenibacillus selenitireducens TaxID=1324314 RepID=A0A1T2XDS7_9BACL|nr:glycine oxidase ThiO [Paenibacillus selenitireducens]OPA77763.1 glycine oxidase ThiO [Paenibacillus selenitireducens]
MQRTVDVVIIGAGVIGCSIAYQLARRGISTRVYDKNQIGAEASSAAAGMLAAQAEFMDSRPLFDLARQSRSLFPALAEELKACSGVDIGFVHHGLLRVARTPEDVLTYQNMASQHVGLGEEAQWLSPEQALELESGLSPSIHGALYFPQDGQVYASQLTLAYAQAAASYGAVFQEFAEVQEIIEDHGCVTGVRLQGEVIPCSNVIVASSMWTQELLSKNGLHVPLFPVKGECIAVKSMKPLLRRTIYTDGCYLVPKSNGEIFIGATVHPHSYDRKVSIGGIAALIQAAEELIPSIRSAEFSRAWSGLRPQTPSGLPYLGEHPMLKHAFIASGHYRNGILLSPITGMLMADLIEGKPPAADLTPFAIPALPKQQRVKEELITGV